MTRREKIALGAVVLLSALCLLAMAKPPPRGCKSPPALTLSAPPDVTTGEPFTTAYSAQPGAGQPGCAVSSWLLDYGDGGSREGAGRVTATDQHAYAADGIYPLSLSAQTLTGLVSVRDQVVHAGILSPPPGGGPCTTCYYVTKTGSDANSCVASKNLGTPKLTIAAGVACLPTGATLYIRTGTYTEFIGETNFTASGTSWVTPITIAAYPGDVVTLRPSGGGGVMGFRNTVAVFLIIDGLILDGINAGGGSGAAVFGCGDTSHHLRVQNTEIKNGDGNGVFCGGNNHEFLNDAVHGNGLFTGYTNSNGMYMWGDATTITGGSFYDNECYGVRYYDSAALPASADNNVVQGARIFGNGNGRGLSGTSVCGSGGGGIVLADTNNVAKNNLVYNNYWGVQISLEKSAAVQWYHNTVTANDFGADMSNSGSSVLFKNNIVYNNAGLNLYQMGSVVQTTNLTTNPNFVNPGAFDFHVNLGSAAIDTGTFLPSVVVDFSGVTRPQGAQVDIGAYER
ncbi:MAG TPA: choice-of-anchor Q domain-containing protein [Gemmatimonadales bacterium]|nr:choice-of-anchor Q domain-containing protein [Gemmatimonadales bacterium]